MDRSDKETSLICTREHMLAAFRLLASDGAALIVLGRADSEAGVQLLARGVVPIAGSVAGGPTQLLLRVCAGQAGQAELRNGPNACGQLAFSIDRGRPDDWEGMVRLPGCGQQSLDRLTLVGQGVQNLFPRDARKVDCSALSARQLERFSRTLGAMGDVTAWTQWGQVRHAMVGCGRTGTLLGHTLCRMGVLRYAILIDPDSVEESDLPDAEAISVEDVGRPKAEVLAGRLSRELEDAGLSGSITGLVGAAPAALDAALSGVLWLSCVDNDAARMAVGTWSCLYHRVLLDVATGVHVGPNGRSVGADVRLLLPGGACMACLGGVAEDRNPAPADPRWMLPRPPWWKLRGGSLRSLNMVATGLGVQMLIDFMSGRLRQSAWAHVAIAEHGQPSVVWRVASASPDRCVLCSRAGSGDAGALRLSN
jgi:hypothetical protein